MSDEIQLYTCPDCKTKIKKFYLSKCSICDSEICCHCAVQIPKFGLSTLCQSCNRLLCKEVKRILREDKDVSEKED